MDKVNADNIADAGVVVENLSDAFYALADTTDDAARKNQYIIKAQELLSIATELDDMSTELAQWENDNE